MILVTGATGTVGLHLIAELVRADVPTRALVRSPEKGAPLRAQRLDTAVGDLADHTSLASALRRRAPVPAQPGLARPGRARARRDRRRRARRRAPHRQARRARRGSLLARALPAR